MSTELIVVLILLVIALFYLASLQIERSQLRLKVIEIEVDAVILEDTNERLQTKINELSK